MVFTNARFVIFCSRIRKSELPHTHSSIHSHTIWDADCASEPREKRCSVWNHTHSHTQINVFLMKWLRSGCLMCTFSTKFCFFLFVSIAQSAIEVIFDRVPCNVRTAVSDWMDECAWVRFCWLLCTKLFQPAKPISGSDRFVSVASYRVSVSFPQTEW